MATSENHVKVKKWRKGLRSKYIETLDVIITSRNHFHMYTNIVSYSLVSVLDVKRHPWLPKFSLIL